MLLPREFLLYYRLSMTSSDFIVHGKNDFLDEQYFYTAASYLMFTQVTALQFHVAFGASDLQTNRLVSPSEPMTQRHAVSIFSTLLNACTRVCCSCLCCSRCSLGTVSLQSGHTHRKRLQCISCKVKLASATSFWLRGRENR